MTTHSSRVIYKSSILAEVNRLLDLCETLRISPVANPETQPLLDAYFDQKDTQTLLADLKGLRLACTLAGHDTLTLTLPILSAMAQLDADLQTFHHARSS
jgi:hypothetical protein